MKSLPVISERKLRSWLDRLPWKRLFWLALVGITFLALIPWTRQLPKAFQWSDKLNHFLAFLLLTLLLMAAYRIGRVRGVAWMTLYGAAIESIQSFLPWRSAEWSDLGVDFLAALAGISLWSLLVALCWTPYCTAEGR